jgi:hypothetical protein
MEESPDDALANAREMLDVLQRPADGAAADSLAR